jgi:hypothetical protein
MDSIEEQVRRFVASRRALAVEKVTGKSRGWAELFLQVFGFGRFVVGLSAARSRYKSQFRI